MLPKKGLPGLLILTLLSLFLFSFAVSAADHTFTIEAQSGDNITKQLQGYLNEASRENGDTYEIIIPPGTYYINYGLTIYSNTTLSMKGVTLVRKTADKTTMIHTPNETNGVTTKKYNGSHHIQFIGGTWDGNAQINPIFRSAHCSYVTFTDVTFTNVKESHHLEIAACKNFTFDGCTFRDFVGKANQKQNHEALQIDIMVKKHFSNFSAFDETPCKNITVENCTFENVQRGVGSHSTIAGSFMNKMIIRNNTFNNVEGYCIIASNYTNSKITGNVCKNCGTGIYFKTTGPSAVAFYGPASGKVKTVKNMKSIIADNEIEVTQQKYPYMAKGIYLYGTKYKKGTSQYPAGDYYVYGVTVANNSVTLKCRGSAIELCGAQNCSVTGNQVVCKITKKGNGTGSGYGIHLSDSRKANISNNSIVNKKHTKYTKNLVGIILVEKSDKAVIQKNKVKGTTSDGIRISASKSVKLKGNTVSNGKRYGIFVKDKAKVKASGNIVKNCPYGEMRSAPNAWVNGKKNYKGSVK